MFKFQNLNHKDLQFLAACIILAVFSFHPIISIPLGIAAFVLLKDEENEDI